MQHPGQTDGRSELEGFSTLTARDLEGTVETLLSFRGVRRDPALQQNLGLDAKELGFPKAIGTYPLALRSQKGEPGVQLSSARHWSREVGSKTPQRGAPVNRLKILPA